MKKAFFAAAVVFVFLVSGCSNKPVTPGATVKIAGSISYQNNSGVIAQTVYSVTVLEGSSPVDTASASVTGPHGAYGIRKRCLHESGDVKPPYAVSKRGDIYCHGSI